MLALVSAVDLDSFSSPSRKRSLQSSDSVSSIISSPRPSKAPRTAPPMRSLRRTETLLSFPTLQSSAAVSTTTHSDNPASQSIQRTLLYYKEQRQRRKGLKSPSEPLNIRTRFDVGHAQPVVCVTGQPQVNVPQQIQPSPRGRKPAARPSPPPNNSFYTPPVPIRHSSPLAPTRNVFPGWPAPPRPKKRVEPNLLRKAITTCMRSSPEGIKILHMGPRLAVSIMTATKDLELLVGENQEDSEKDGADVVMADDPKSGTRSWIMLHQNDWEMSDSTS